MVTILQGDDTAANRKTIRLKFPADDIGDGFTIGLDFFGIVKSGAYVPSGSITFDYTREQTATFPLGINYARLYLEKDGLMATLANLPICVTDSAERANASANDVNLSVVINTGVPHVDKDALKRSSTISEIKELANALLAAVNGSAS